MVCLYCGSKTKITNSRYNKELHKTWRRHRCTNCNWIFTTYESIDMLQAVMVKKRSGKLEPFYEYKLFTSIKKSIDHISQPAKNANMLVQSVLRLVYRDLNGPVVTSLDLDRYVASVLKRFNAAAAVKYLSYKSNMQLPKDVRKALF